MFAERRTSRRRRTRPDDGVASGGPTEQLEAVIRRQQQEIATLELAAAEHRRLLKEAQRQTTRLLRRCDDAIRPDLEKLRATITGGTAPSRSRRTLEEWFDQSKRSFVRRPSSRCPKLTPTELKVCALLKLNLRTREIASLLQTSVRSIENHRYWIRRKIELPTSVNLATFLTGV